MAYAYVKHGDTTKAREVVRIREERGIRRRPTMWR